jgi:ethanolamine phosphate phosphodiesterase
MRVLAERIDAQLLGTTRTESEERLNAETVAELPASVGCVLVPTAALGRALGFRDASGQLSMGEVGRLGESWFAVGKRTRPNLLTLTRTQPAGATPHRAVLIADPQLIDAHTYPGRPWPLSSLTILITDNYLRRSYNQLLDDLMPDTLLFLGDLFDGGREWESSKDPVWSHRPAGEQGFASVWKKKYGQNYWMKEYARFSDIFLKPWVKSADFSRPDQRGRKIIASLPGNHDLGFGSEIKVTVRNRFETYFGEPNRVDIIGNHTFVSVDTVSLSADTSDEEGTADLRNIYKPTEHFLNDLPYLKRKAIARELRHQRGQPEELQHAHRIEELPQADFSDRPESDPGEASNLELPTVLLSHVPLFRPAGTPCGPLREHWPPSKPYPGWTTPVHPDPRNALSLSRGYQYQNVLNQQDTLRIVYKLGSRIAHAFSGDDHDYCEINHDPRQGSMPEITVKSISMAMGVPTPGFVLVSMWNPIDGEGRSLLSEKTKTIQTHLCLLPNQIATYTKYIIFAIVSLIALVIRALLVPVLGLSSFALDPSPYVANVGGFLLPRSYTGSHKAKVEDYDSESASGTTAGYSASSRIHSASTSSKRARSPSIAAGKGSNGQTHSNTSDNLSRTGSGKSRRHSKASSTASGWGWGSTAASGPKIKISGDDEDAAYLGDGMWKPASSGRGRPRSTVGTLVREILATAWRVFWIVFAFLAYLTWKG